MGQRGRGMPRFFPQEEAPVGVLQPPMRRAEQRSARSQPDVPLTQRRSPLGRLNVKNEEIDEMIKEAPGPINFTVFLTMFGEKLKGEGVPRELGGWAHTAAKVLSHLGRPPSSWGLHHPVGSRRLLGGLRREQPKKGRWG